MNPAAAAFLTCLLLVCAQGQPANRSSRCKCLNGYVGRINSQLIQTQLIHPASIFCPRLEIIITIANKQKCVNPLSPLGKLLLKKSKDRKSEAVSTTTAGVQTNTSSSTGIHKTAAVKTAQ